MMITLLLLIFSSIVTGNIVISDPHCPVTMTPYGSATISYDIIRSSINVTILFDTQSDTYSCYLCDTIGSDYCNASGDNIRLSNELSYNVYALFTQNNKTLSFDVSHATPSVIIDVPRDIPCDQPLNLVLVAFVEVRQPSLMIFLVTLQEEGNNQIGCQDDALLFADFDCSVIGPNYHYITIDTSNCIWPSPYVETIPSNISVSFDDLYWYSEALTDNLGSVPLTLTFCSLGWLDILRESQLSYQCGDYASYYVATKPWYTLFIAYTSTRLNTINDCPSHIKPYLLLTYDTLERDCRVRDSTEEEINNTVYADLYHVLQGFNTENSLTHEWCDTIRESLNKTDLDEGFIPLYVSLYKKWYFRYASLLIMYSDDMEIKFIVVLVLLAIASTVFLCALTVLPLWMVLVRCYKNRKKASHAPYYDAL